MRKFLLLSVIRSDFSKMLGLAKLLRENGHEVAFYFEQRSHDLYQSIDEAIADGFKVFGSRKPRNVKNEKTSRPIETLPWWTKLPVFIKRVVNELKSISAIQRDFRRAVNEYRPNALIVSVCSVGYNIPVYAAQSRRLKLQTICVPFAIGDKDATQKAIKFAPKSAHDYLLNNFFKGLFSNWYLVSTQGNFAVLPAEMLVAYKINKVTVAYPLSFYGTYVDILLLENEYMLMHARTQSLAAGKVLVTGSIFDDQLANARSNRKIRYEALCKRFSWDSSRRLICIALPPLVNDKNSNSRFFDFDVLMKRFVPEDCDFSSINVLVSLHPRINPDLIRSYPCADNVKLLAEPVEMLAPYSDFFISTYSSTIRTALALRIPVINYDILNFDYTLFSDLAGVAHVRDESQYREVLLEFIGEGVKYKELVRSLQISNMLNATLDGRSNERILNAITQQP